MPEFFPSVEAWFDAGHLIPGDAECAHEHGHRWQVRVTLRGSYDPQTGRSADVAHLKELLFGIAAELARKPLNAMIAPGQPTPEGIGLWIMERLLPEFPKIAEVRVCRDPQVSYSIKREPR
jgi:6-pyruvoyl-tetrahydropterin synthase